MKIGKTAVIWIITVLFVLLVAWYGAVILWGVNAEGNVPGIVRWGVSAAVSVIAGTLIVLMIITTLRRKREIDEEDEDDLGKY
jgi:hypothetical protein